jgi:deoxyribonuclease IV
MPLFGAHMSIAGGHYKALLSAVEQKCQAVQLFTKNSNQWNAKEISEGDAMLFRRTLRRTGIRFPMAHSSYLLNLASPDEALYRRSIAALLIEMFRAEQLGLRYLVIHPGCHMGGGENAGLVRIARALDEVHGSCPDFRVRILLETTAGQGTSLGHRFEHLAQVMALVKQPRRLGVRLDTCHVFAAGYRLSPANEYRATFQAFDKVVGLGKLRAFHLNDSKREFGTCVDRHAHIGQGSLGIEPFRLLVNDARFAECPMILETPKEDGSVEDMDGVNLQLLRSLLRQPSATRSEKRTRAGTPRGELGMV